VCERETCFLFFRESEVDRVKRQKPPGKRERYKKERPGSVDPTRVRLEFFVVAASLGVQSENL
jgi:hypothetical protein